MGADRDHDSGSPWEGACFWWPGPAWRWGLYRWFEVNFATVHALGYVEGRFARVRVGMDRAEVESVAGKPLRVDTTRWPQCETWVYSDPSPPGRISGNYWRRWVFFTSEANGKVIVIVSDYYED